MRIALIGSRGIPANYGGFETLFEHLAVGLVEDGFDVTVYCRRHHTPKALDRFKGVELVSLPTLRTRHLDTPVHTFISCLHAAARNYDAVVMVNGANCVFLPILQAFGTPVALNVDGIEKQRTKWGRIGRRVYSVSEKLATIMPDRLITDAEVIHRHYLENYSAPSTVITYGVDPEPLEPGPIMAKLGLESRKYFLYVSRFEPENNPHRVAEAYRDVPGDLPLVMIGDAPYADQFIKSFTSKADPRILFPGAIFGAGYRELLSHPLAYIQATEVGGSHPALIEAMGYGNCLVVNNTPENREVAGGAALFFDASDQDSLAEALSQALDHPHKAAALRGPAAERAQGLYSWDQVVEAYSRLLIEIAGSIDLEQH